MHENGLALDSQTTQTEDAHDFKFLLQRFLQLLKQRHWNEQDYEVGQGIEASSDRRPKRGIDAMTRLTERPI